MPFSALICVLWIFITAGHSETDLFSQTLGINLFSDASLASTNNELSFEGGDALGSLTEADSTWSLEDNTAGLNPITGLNSNLFLADNIGLDSAIELDPMLPLDTIGWDLMPESTSISLLPDADLTSLISFTDSSSLLRDSIWDRIDSPLANQIINCEVSNGDSIPLFDKRRRETSCSNPDLDSDSVPPTDGESDPYAPQPVPHSSSTDYFAYAFPEEFEICPRKIFKASNIPVCKEGSPSPEDVYSQVGQSWMHLYDVSPCTSVHDLDLFRTL